MTNNDPAIPSKSGLPVLFVVLTAYSLLILSSFHYERLTGDTTLYLSIAEKYLAGDFSNAINGYWGPLLSWLFIPLLALGASHLLAINALNLVFGILTIIGVWRLSFRFEISGTIRAYILLILVPVLLLISLIQPMDFLLLCVLVYYLAAAFDKNYPYRLSHAVSAGFLGALMYFSKPYGLPFFLSHFVLINVYHFVRNGSKEIRRNVVRNVFAGLIIFSLLSGAWIGLISKKYNQLTFSMMGKGVFAVYKPGTSHETLEKGDPIFFEGFFEPPNDTAFVIYEDPTYARKKIWNPLDSKRSLRYFIKNIAKNVLKALRIYDSYSRLSGTIIIAYVLLILSQSRNKAPLRIDLLFPLLTILLYTGGYMPFHFELRYLWIVNILLLLMGGTVLNELFKYDFYKRNIVKNTLIFFFVASFIVSPIKSAFETVRHNINREMHVLGMELNRRYDIHGNLASNRHISGMTTQDSWHKTFRLAYWLKSRYYGQPRENIKDEELEAELKKYDIDYYFCWGDRVNAPKFLSQFKEVTQGEIPDLRIYYLKEKTSS